MGTAYFMVAVLAGGDRSGSLSNAAGGRSTGGHALHAGSEGAKVSEQRVPRVERPGLEQR